MSDQRSVQVLDRLVIFWVVLWLVLGAAVGVTLWRAADLGDTVSRSGGTLRTLGESLGDLADLPLVPERPREIGEEVQVSAAEITERGQEVKQQLRLLGVLLGIAVVGIPISPVAGVYLPLRARRQKELRRLRRSVRDHADAASLDRWLAGRARASLVYEEVARIEDQTAGDPRRTDRLLADAELRRLGLRRPAASTGPGPGA